MAKVEAEEGPEIVVGPMCEPGTDDLRTWLITMHVGLCAKGGVNCRTCEEAKRLGIAMPA